MLFPPYPLLITLVALGGVLLGALLTALVLRGRTAAQIDAAIQRTLADARAELSTLEERARGLREDLERERGAHATLLRRAEDLRDTLDEVSDERARLQERASRVEPLEIEVQHANSQQALIAAELARVRQDLATTQTRLDGEQAQAAEKLALLGEAREELANRFKTLANDILEDKSRKFTEQNRENLGQLLGPLATQIGEFRKKVEDVYVQEGKDRTELASQVRQLMDLNQLLSQDAKNLTSALKGSVKTQGNWGEMLLERLLEHAGLARGFHYEVQDSQVREDGSRALPDFVLRLPNERRMVIDAKVTLLAYDRYVAAEDDSQRALALKAHVEAVRSHMKGLSEKNYQKLYALQSIDFVVMYMPVEPAFTLAAAHDETLFDEAWRKNVLIVTNSTLLFVIRTVAYLWNQEKQNRNAQEIAQRGAELYDKLVLFAEEMTAVGARLQQAQDSYTISMRRLSEGRGNLIRQAERLKSLGVKPSRTMPPQLREAALPDGDDSDAAEALPLELPRTPD